MLVVHGGFHYKITGIIGKQNNENKKDKSIKAYPFYFEIKCVGLRNLATGHLVLGLNKIIWQLY